MEELSILALNSCRCNGFTAKGTRCKNRTFYGVYCEKHILQETRPCWDNLPTYPAIGASRKLVPFEKYKSNTDLEIKIKELLDLGVKSQNIYFDRFSFFGICELMLYNRNLIIKNKGWEFLVKKVLPRIKNQGLTEYHDYFRKSLCHEYRVQFQRVYVEFFFKGTDLGPDLGKHIASFL